MATKRQSKKAVESTPAATEAEDNALGYPFPWPGSAPGAEREWYEFTMASDDPEDPAPTVYRVDLSFYLSNWQCMFGTCPGILMTGATPHTGCCQIGVEFGDGSGDHDEAREDFEKVRGYVGQLTPDDCDNLEEIEENGWYSKKTFGQRKGFRGVRRPYKTRMVNGGCVFINRADGSSGKPGCSLHHLANRLGVHYSETKPRICWMVPYSVTSDYDEDNEQYVVTMTGTGGNVWGHTDNSDTSHIGFWCTETPDAYKTSTEKVYRSAETELRLLIGDKPYEELVRRLDGIQRRVPMPGETIAGGRPLIPLLVKQRVDNWATEARDGRDDPYYDAATALDNSKEYLTANGITPQPRKA